MIAGWVAYCLLLSTLLAVIGSAAEMLVTKNRRPARWIWIVAIAASIAIPAALVLLQRRAPTPIPDAAEVRFDDVFQRLERRERLAQAPSNASILARAPRLRIPQWLGADRLVTAAIIACILTASARVAPDSLVLFRSRRGWRPGQLDGERVFLSESQGPALVGLLEPSIVLPEWATQLDATERALMLTHEREHRRAHDGIVASAALFGTLCMPWSPAMWWMFRRLRIAIEIDCDRRVLTIFPDVARYGRLLVDVAERAKEGSSLAITGFSERAGSLARRIRAMTPSAEHRRRLELTRAGHGAAAIGAIAAMFVVLPPIPAAREMTRPDLPTPALLPKGVADSIASMTEDASIRTGFLLVGRARDLPTAFEVLDPGNGDRMPWPGRCARFMRDPRNGTEIQLRRSESRTGAITQHGDTAWTRIATFGLYRVRTPGMYGVAEDQFLRVGCGATTKTTIVGKRVGTGALSDLESTTDDRARRIASAVESAIHYKPELVELYPGRLNVAITDRKWISTGGDADWSVVKAVWAAVRDQLGQSSLPETLAFSVRVDDGSGITRYSYKSQFH